MQHKISVNSSNDAQSSYCYNDDNDDDDDDNDNSNSIYSIDKNDNDDNKNHDNDNDNNDDNSCRGQSIETTRQRESMRITKKTVDRLSPNYAWNSI